MTPAAFEKPGMRGLLKAGQWLLILALGCFSSLAAPAVDSNRNLDVWPVEDWPHNTVTSIAQTTDGYLWFGTYHGLIRYDGARFTVFDGSNTPGLRNGIITSLHLDSAGDLWIGHETGEITRMGRGQFTAVSSPKPWPGGPVEGFAQDEDQLLWLWNDRGQLFRFSDGKLLDMGIGSPVRKAGVSRAADGSLWVGLGQRVSRLHDGELANPDPSLISPGLSIEAVRGARDGGFWILTREWIRKIKNGRVTAEFPPAATVENSITTTLELRNGNLLVATSRDGLTLLEPGHPAQRFTRADGLLHDWVRALFEDHEGNVWVGTASGLNGLRHRRVHMIAPPDDWKGCALLSFSLRKDGSLWIGTEGAGLYRLTGNQWSRFAMEEGLPNNYVWSVLETRQGELMVGTWGAGVVLATNETFAPAGELGHLTSPTPSLYQGRGGEIWVGTTTGLLRYESGRIVQSFGKGQLDFPDVRAITETQDGTLWFGMSGGGLGALRGGTVSQYRKGNAGLNSDFVLSLSPDSDGTLWIGTGDAGLVRLRDQRFTPIGRAQGLLDSVIGHIVDDGNGCLWLGSRQGILRVSKSELHQAADGALRSIHCLSYGKPEGLEAPAISGGFQPGACKTEDGRLWFPTTKGLAVLDGRDIRGNAHPPPVVIEELTVDGQTIPLPFHSGKEQQQAVRVPPGRQRFELRYTGLSFAAPDKVRFRYRLEGLESDWIEAGTRRVAPYSYLRPGTYRFRVIACNNDNVWNETGAELRFTVLPFFWQTWWFKTVSIAAAALSLGGAVFWISRRRIRRKLELLERQRALERERARIARDIHDDLGASLTRITMLSQGVRSDVQALPNTSSDVDQIYQTARETTRALDEIVWAVNPRHDTLDSLVTYLGRFAQSFLSTAGIRCRLDVPVQLPAWALTSEIRHNLFLALKESLNNVAKHARATEVRISLELQEDGFLIHVVDNGCGFQQQPGEPLVSSNGGGNGLNNMRKRVEELGGRCEWTTAPGEGTRVCFSISRSTTPHSNGI